MLKRVQHDNMNSKLTLPSVSKLNNVKQVQHDHILCGYFKTITVQLPTARKANNHLSYNIYV